MRDGENIRQVSKLGVDYIGMIPYLQAVLKEQEQRIKELEEKLKTKGD